MPRRARDEDAVSTSPTDKQIAALAFQYYEDEGRPEGRADEYWQRAVDSLRATQERESGPIGAGGEEFP